MENVKGDLSFISEAEKVAIFTHETPDPDAIGSAIGLQWILKKKYDVQSDIFYSGEISHPENKTMINILSISMKTCDDYDADIYDKVIVVDGTEKTVGFEIKADGIIDHHRVEVSKEKHEFIYLKEVGSCSTLIVNLIQENELSFSHSDDDKIVTTSLMHGLKKDTYNLLQNVHDIDDEAHKFLRPYVDFDKIFKIVNYPLPKYFFELEREIMHNDNHTHTNGTFYGFLGMLSPTKRDALPMLADKMIRMEDVTTTFIVGIIGDQIEASVRSMNISNPVDQICKQVFGKNNAGGKKMAGGAKIHLKDLGFSEDPKEVKDAFCEAIKRKFMHKVTEQAKGNV